MNPLENATIAERLGSRTTPGFQLGEALWEPLPEEELRYWDGYMGDTSPLHPDNKPFKKLPERPHAGTKSISL